MRKYTKEDKMENVYKLTETLEGCEYAKVNFVIDEEYVNADLGYVDVNENDEEVFVPEYTSAVVKKTQLINYTEENEQ
jgi:hypothetical protein